MSFAIVARNGGEEFEIAAFETAEEAAQAMQEMIDFDDDFGERLRIKYQKGEE